MEKDGRRDSLERGPAARREAARRRRLGLASADVVRLLAFRRLLALLLALRRLRAVALAACVRRRGVRGSRRERPRARGGAEASCSPFGPAFCPALRLACEPTLFGAWPLPGKQERRSCGSERSPRP
jgi:hypothetical protein